MVEGAATSAAATSFVSSSYSLVIVLSGTLKSKSAHVLAFDKKRF
jgi:hypothetical protein